MKCCTRVSLPDVPRSPNDVYMYWGKHNQTRAHSISKANMATTSGATAPMGNPMELVHCLTDAKTTLATTSQETERKRQPSAVVVCGVLGSAAKLHTNYTGDRNTFDARSAAPFVQKYVICDIKRSGTNRQRPLAGDEVQLAIAALIRQTKSDCTNSQGNRRGIQDYACIFFWAGEEALSIRRCRGGDEIDVKSTLLYPRALAG